MYFWHIRIHRFHELISINFKVQISLNNTEIINTRNLNKVRIQNSQSAFELSIYWTLSTINVTRIVTGTLLWLIRILNKIHNSLICIVFNVFCSFPRNHISLSFDWRDLEWSSPECSGNICPSSSALLTPSYRVSWLGLLAATGLQ